MDFLDPKKQRQHEIRLLIGYVLIGLGILMTTYLSFQIVGKGIARGKNGEIVQNGFLYLSSQPAGAEISLNGKDIKAKTNTRRTLVSGQYDVRLSRQGYRAWQRQVMVEGASVEHYDYPFLFPVSLKTTAVKAYDSAPALATQSPNRRWLVVQRPGASSSFDIYDRDNPKTTAIDATLPSGVATDGTAQSWQLAEWSTDNVHVLLKHLYDGKTEFIMLDRSDPTKSLNLNQQLGFGPSDITLRDKKYDQYYIYDPTTQLLQTASLSQPTPQAYLEHVLSYQSYGADIMLYASSASSGSGKVAIDLLQGGKTYNLREVTAGGTYLLNLTQYSGSWYVALGASSEGKVYVYKNPVKQLGSKRGILVPIAVLKTPQPKYLAFSDNAQFIMAESGSQFAVYDAENDTSYSYDAHAALDAPQAHATWMDGHRLAYVSNGKLVVFDYDHANTQTLMAANSGYQPFFSSNYKFVDTMGVTGSDGKAVLNSTALLTPADQ